MTSLPEWLKIPYVEYGYRIGYTRVECVKSIFDYRHNESFNIYTHLVPGIFGVWLMIAGVLNELHILYNIGFVVCMLCSSVFHIMYCHSEETCLFFLMLDLLGISVLLCIQDISVIYIMYAHTMTLCFTFIMSSIITTFTPFLLCVMNWFDNYQYGQRRFIVFMMCTCISKLPILYGFCNGFVSPLFIHYEIKAGACAIMGSLLYISYIPERYISPKYNYYITSHTLFHIFIVIGCVYHFYAILTYYESS